MTGSALAENIYGDQFCFHSEEIYQFNVETGELTRLASNLEDFAEKLLLDFRFLSGHPTAHAWQVANGPLPPRCRLMPGRLFVFGVSYEVSNFAAIDSLELMSFMGHIATQIRDVPDGSKIKIIIHQSPSDERHGTS